MAEISKFFLVNPDLIDLVPLKLPGHFFAEYPAKKFVGTQPTCMYTSGMIFAFDSKEHEDCALLNRVCIKSKGKEQTSRTCLNVEVRKLLEIFLIKSSATFVTFKFFKAEFEDLHVCVGDDICI